MRKSGVARPRTASAKGPAAPQHTFSEYEVGKDKHKEVGEEQWRSPDQPRVSSNEPHKQYYYGEVFHRIKVKLDVDDATPNSTCHVQPDAPI